ncbi:alpha/beta fold hydrolase [Telmatospirillum siberiense]|uniref:Alpha/beta hydrolase n=1 Tax=Telmatospirillum siberiense TaxID=382514 RepID=A0A2N3PYU3_9PROT|nr:alpha/beta hydrolase [Telmatospirillum siberiense]PKU25549.1 alpha/beta hydrolase [Telmatospirillum siberiense]
MLRKYLPVLGLHGFHRLAYREWGDPANPKLLLCVHGLTRCGGDFDHLARRLASTWRVVCPDMPGRGDSEWLPVKSDYAVPTYLADCAALIARLGVDTVDWLGTSMGGIIGIHLAAMPGSPIRRLILNDIGPFIPAAGLRRIGVAVGSDPHFSDRTQALSFLQTAMASFGIHQAEHWQHMLDISTRPDGAGGLRLHYDPGLAEGFHQSVSSDIEFWAAWDALACPVLTLRGVESDILLPETAREMTARGPKARLVEFAGCGHAPALMEPEQIAVIEKWLNDE